MRRGAICAREVMIHRAPAKATELDVINALSSTFGELFHVNIHRQNAKFKGGGGCACRPRASPPTSSAASSIRTRPPPRSREARCSSSGRLVKIQPVFKRGWRVRAGKEELFGGVEEGAADSPFASALEATERAWALFADAVAADAVEEVEEAVLAAGVEAAAAAEEGAKDAVAGDDTYADRLAEFQAAAAAKKRLEAESKPAKEVAPPPAAADTTTASTRLSPQRTGGLGLSAEQRIQRVEAAGRLSASTNAPSRSARRL